MIILERASLFFILFKDGFALMSSVVKHTTVLVYSTTMCPQSAMSSVVLNSLAVC